MDGVNIYQRDVLEAPPEDEDQSSPEQEQATVEEQRQAILAQARQEAEAKVREAYEEGLRRGADAAREAFAEEVGQAGEVLGKVAGELREARQAFLRQLEPQVLEMVRAICRRILKREARTDPDLVRNVTRTAIAALLDREQVLVRVNPSDLEVLREYKPALLEELDGVAKIDVMADETVETGGCIVDSQTLYLDAQLKAQLDRLFEALAE